MSHYPDDDSAEVELLRSINANLRGIQVAIGWLTVAVVLGFGTIFHHFEITILDLF
jgi:hypothetical protein